MFAPARRFRTVRFARAQILADAFEHRVDRVAKHAAALAEGLHFLRPDFDFVRIQRSASPDDGWNTNRHVVQVVAAVLHS